jgi:hypothetical protein
LVFQEKQVTGGSVYLARILMMKAMRRKADRNLDSAGMKSSNSFLSFATPSISAKLNSV